MTLLESAPVPAIVADILFAIVSYVWFFLPAGVANMAPVIATRFLGKGRPIDGGATIRGKRIFGDNKTWQGLIIGVIAGFVCYLLQLSLAHLAALRVVSVIDYGSTSIFLGVALGLGALVGDLGKSFLKRQANVAPGKVWIPFDQLDYVVGGFLLTLPFIRLPLTFWLGLLVTFFVLHILVNLLGWLLGVKENKL
jgi:CDP-2,3-bis-(O-geranylgeranyl)-sn-glycerol synthase